MKNLIGISGKIQSGKDTVGKIIQELDSNRNWQIRKFADTLKDVTCLILGCTREQLEDREFKEKELGEEWDIKIITYMDGELHKIYNPSDYEDFDIKCKYPISYTSNIIKQTPRSLLQKIGTDLFRNQLHPNVWINATMAEYQPIAGTMDVRRSRETFPNWIITDVRFPNEADAIRKRGGIIIRVNRKHGYNTPDGKWKEMPINYHESETALDNYRFDYAIDNNGSIEQLEKKVKEIYKHFLKIT